MSQWKCGMIHCFSLIVGHSAHHCFDVYTFAKLSTSYLVDA